MDRLGHADRIGRGRGGRPVGQQLRQVVVTGRGQLPRVARFAPRSRASWQSGLRARRTRCAAGHGAAGRRGFASAHRAGRSTAGAKSDARAGLPGVATDPAGPLRQRPRPTGRSHPYKKPYPRKRCPSPLQSASQIIVYYSTKVHIQQHGACAICGTIYYYNAKLIHEGREGREKVAPAVPIGPLARREHRHTAHFFAQSHQKADRHVRSFAPCASFADHMSDFAL